MPGINTFTIVGNVIKDVELQYMCNGMPYVTFIVAVNDIYYGRDGKKHVEADIIPVTSYGKQAMNCSEFLKRGSAVAVLGRIRSWDKPSEHMRKGGFSFVASRVLYLGRPCDHRAVGDSGQQHEPVCSEHDDWVRDYDSAIQS